jgi:hypothetical protein
MASVRFRGAAHWTGVALALAPVPFAVYDIVHLQLWRDLRLWAFGIGFTLVLSAVIYGAVRGVFWLINRLRRGLSNGRS